MLVLFLTNGVGIWLVVERASVKAETSQSFHFDTGANKTQGTVPLEWRRWPSHWPWGHSFYTCSPQDAGSFSSASTGWKQKTEIPAKQIICGINKIYKKTKMHTENNPAIQEISSFFLGAKDFGNKIILGDGCSFFFQVSTVKEYNWTLLKPCQVLTLNSTQLKKCKGKKNALSVIYVELGFI